jgi:hypothetical protein
MLAGRFTETFREEHREVRDALLQLIDAFEQRDRQAIGTLLERIARLTGPHFRYEEESLYPELVQFFGTDYVEHLFSEHDRAIGRARRLVQLAEQSTLSDEDVAHAARLVRAILPHVSDCDGLSIMVERLPNETIETIFDARARSGRAGLNLLQWADQVRRRPIAPVV